MDFDEARNEILTRWMRARAGKRTLEAQIIERGAGAQRDGGADSPDWDDRANII